MYNERLLNEMNSCYDKWSKTINFKNLSEDKAKIVAVLLENQQLINEMSTDTGDIVNFKRISFSIVIKAFGEFINLNLVNVFPMLGPTQTFGGDTFTAITRKLKSHFTCEQNQDLRAEPNLDGENKLIETSSEEILEDFVEEITNDLRENSKQFGDLIKSEDLLNQINCLIEKENIEWIGGNRHTIKKILSNKFNDFSDSQLAGYYTHNGKKIAIYLFKNFPERELLASTKDSFTYGMYVPLTQTPTVLNPETFAATKSFMTRYSKKIDNKKPIFKLKLKFELIDENISKEIDKVYSKWANTDLLKGLDNDKSKILSVILESQDLMNKQIKDMGDVAAFKRICFPIVSKVFGKLLNLDLVNVFPMLSPTQIYGEINLFAVTRLLKTIWGFEVQQNLMSQHNINADQEKMEIISESIFTEIANEIITDLSVAAKKLTATNNELFENINYLIAKENIDWIGGSGELVSKITGRICNKDNYFQVVGFYEHNGKKISVYSLPGIPENELLAVEKDAYLYGAYVPLTQTPVVLDPESFTPRKGFITRYSKKVLNNKSIFKLTFSS